MAIALLLGIGAQVAASPPDTIWYSDSEYVEVETNDLYEDYETEEVYDEYTEADADYLGSDQAPKEFDEEAHARIAKRINDAFAEPEPEEPEPERKKAEKDDNAWEDDGFHMPQGPLKIVLVILVVAAIAVLLYFVFKNTLFVTNTKVDAATYRLMEEIEDDLPNSDLNSYLERALADGNHKLAIRIYYLTIIQTLQDDGLIVWKKDKTNNAYLREMRKHETYRQFRATTRAFERVWYSNMKFGQSEYYQLSPRFEAYLKTLQK